MFLCVSSRTEQKLLVGITVSTEGSEEEQSCAVFSVVLKLLPLC